MEHTSHQHEEKLASLVGELTFFKKYIADIQEKYKRSLSEKDREIDLLNRKNAQLAKRVLQLQHKKSQQEKILEKKLRQKDQNYTQDLKAILKSNTLELKDYCENIIVHRKVDGHVKLEKIFEYLETHRQLLTKKSAHYQKLNNKIHKLTKQSGHYKDHLNKKDLLLSKKDQEYESKLTDLTLMSNDEAIHYKDQIQKLASENDKLKSDLETLKKPVAKKGASAYHPSIMSQDFEPRITVRVKDKEM